MKLKLLLSTFLTAVTCFWGMAAGEVAIIPLPASVTPSSGEFVFSDLTTYSVPQYAGDSVSRVFDLVVPEIQKASNSRFEKVAQKGRVALTLDKSLGEEAYTLEIGPDGINISASRPAGFFYALQSLRQMLPYTSVTGQVSLPAMAIADAPRFGWRGFMLDEGRHIFGRDEVKKVLDLMAAYKMNRFHWHLTEDQGWRIEIKAYPELTNKGAYRGSTTLGWQELQPDTVSYSGFYTHADIREIVDYARDRFIEIVPEIDIPGHTQAAVAAYPEILACDPENPHEVWLMQGVSPDVMNVANPEAVKMAKAIIDEVAELFPYPYLHLGGDECPTDKWENNAECQALLKRIGSTNYRDLQLNFYRELASHIASKPADKQRKLIFWNEVLHGNTSMLPEDITVMAWIGADAAAKEAAERGFTTILSPQIPYYINRMQSTQDGEPLSQGTGTENLERVYEYVPMKDIPAALQDKYMGVQANFWSEYVDSPELLEYLMLPRLAAVAEAGWTPQNLRDYEGFRQRVRTLRPMYDAGGYTYGRHEFMNEGETPDTFGD